MTGQAVGSVDAGDFRAALGRFASGVTVVTTTWQGVDHAMTASAFTSVSLDPPQVLVCSHRTSRFHDAVIESGIWGVSVLSVAGTEASAWFANRGRALESQFDRVPHHRGDTGVVLLDAALGWLECRTSAVHDGGDHAIIVGDVVGAGVDDSEDDPLLYYRSHYGTIVRSPQSEKSFDQGER